MPASGREARAKHIPVAGREASPCNAAGSRKEIRMPVTTTMDPGKVQAMFKEFPALEEFRKVAPRDVYIHVAKPDEGFYQLRVPYYPVRYDRLQAAIGYVLMFDESGKCVYSLGRTRMNVNGMACRYETPFSLIQDEARGKALAVVGIILMLALLLPFPIFLRLLIVIVGLVFLVVGAVMRRCAVSRMEAGRRAFPEECASETIDDAVVRLGDGGNAISLVVVYDPEAKFMEYSDFQHAPRITIYKMPKGHSLASWRNLMLQAKRDEIKTVVSAIDESSMQDAVKAQAAVAPKAHRSAGGVCSNCNAPNQPGARFCRRCGAAFLGIGGAA